MRCVAAWAKEPRIAATLPASMAENARRLNMVSSRNFVLRRSNARIGRSATAKWRRLRLARPASGHRVHQSISFGPSRRAMDKARKTRHGSAENGEGENDGFEA